MKGDTEMIKIILDNGNVIKVTKPEDLTAEQLKQIFRTDPRTDTLLTYVVTPQPVSRRIKPTT